MIDSIATGKNIRRLRKDNGITNAKLSEKLNVSLVSIYKWQNGTNVPSLDNLVELKHILGCGLDDLVEEM